MRRSDMRPMPFAVRILGGAAVGALVFALASTGHGAAPGDASRNHDVASKGDQGDACNPTDISGVPPQTVFDYDTDIQSIFDDNCVGCHFGPQGAAQLDLTPGASYNALVNVPSPAGSGLMRVDPGEPAESLLFLKVNCATPPTGERMPLFGELTVEEQARIHDWIAAGAPTEPVLFVDGFEDPEPL